MSPRPTVSLSVTRSVALSGIISAVMMGMAWTGSAWLSWPSALALVALYIVCVVTARTATTVTQVGLVAGVTLQTLLVLAHAGFAASQLAYLCAVPFLVASRLGQRELGWLATVATVWVLMGIVGLHHGIAVASATGVQWASIALLLGLVVQPPRPATQAVTDSHVGHSRTPVPAVRAHQTSGEVVPEISRAEGEETSALRRSARTFHRLMGVILTSAEIVRDECRDHQMTSEDLDILLRNANEASDLALRLLTVTRDDAVDTGSIEIDALLGNLHDDLQAIAGPDVPIAVQVLPGLQPIHMDPSHLTDVLFELVRNASEAMDGVGEIRIAAYVDPSVPAGRLRVVVEDTGPGMSQAIRARAFDPFFTTQSSSAANGLGLSMVRSVVRRCGGRVHLGPGAQGGTRVWLDLPYVAAGDGLGRTGGVVVVGTDHGDSGVVASLLRDAGYSVRFVVDSAQALQALSIADGTAELVVLEASADNLRLANLIARDWEHLDVVWMGRGVAELSPSVQVMHNVPVYAVVDELVRLTAA